MHVGCKPCGQNTGYTISAYYANLSLTKILLLQNSVNLRKILIIEHKNNGLDRRPF